MKPFHRRIFTLTIVSTVLLLILIISIFTSTPTSYAPRFKTFEEGILPEGISTTLVWVTAYSSSVDETNSNPYQTASQTPPRDGIIASNFLPFGTIVTIPELFGDRVFVVEDRLHPRKQWVIDIWMKSKEDAKEFGAHLTDIVVIRRPKS